MTCTPPWQSSHSNVTITLLPAWRDVMTCSTLSWHNIDNRLDIRWRFKLTNALQSNHDSPTRIMMQANHDFMLLRAGFPPLKATDVSTCQINSLILFWSVTRRLLTHSKFSLHMYRLCVLLDHNCYWKNKLIVLLIDSSWHTNICHDTSLDPSR